MRKLSYSRDGDVQNLRLFEHFYSLYGAGVDDHRLLLIDQKVTLEERCSEFLTQQGPMMMGYLLILRHGKVSSGSLLCLNHSLHPLILINQLVLAFDAVYSAAMVSG